ncbi:uncharacterized protein HMPREF1541_03374 [Cyphellophora europaea CBS 101466]|uniref:FAS1 domain-containing protein n=1 Tax=Cyphellophora europaea (strain CBS 101466) TaxID=1220924 RepID=W2S093_CYPE1|nr:uncharacterized protein HMPREF1541_03374 [Cyphellophora europaea CBS 101466]ETN41438.1 hypothetical protein HMPREF1541_03374 [Cyphellophora europaea CBS 101466]
MRFLLLGPLLFAGLCYCADQDVLTILNQQAGISTFISHLESYPDLIDTLNNGTFTVLAPSNDAFSAFATANPEHANDTSYMEALIQYHIALNTHPSAEFGLTPLFPRTLLTSPDFTNVTGGQRIELTIQDSRPTILSGVKAASALQQPDIFFQGGLIHVIDSVLTIPDSFPSTITRAKLNNLIALLNKGGWLNPSSPAITIINDLSDLTVFGPDSPQFGAGFTGFDALSENELNAIFRYSIVQNSPPLYSSEFRNASTHRTLQNLSLTFTEANGGFYADAARITQVDYLVSNGVLQVLDIPLNPDTTGIGPVVNTPEPKSSSKGLSPAGAAGLGIGIGAIILGGGIVVALVLRSRQRRGLPLFGNPRRFGQGQMRLPEEETPGIPRNRRRSGGNSGRHSTARALELSDAAPPPRYGAHELDNKGSTPMGSPGGGGGGRGTVHVVELRSPREDGANGRSTLMTTDVEYASTTGGGGTVRAVDRDGRTVTVYDNRGRPLPPKPPSPQEIDGEERSRISISITGEAPRHLGFQARFN